MTETNESNLGSRANLAMEYTTLRDEILKRVEMRLQILSITLTFAAAFLGFGLTEVAVAFVYPPLAMMLALSWYQNDHQVRRIADYIRANHEGIETGLLWETKTQQSRDERGNSSWRFVVLSHGGIFVITQLMAIAIGLSNFTESAIEWILLGFDVFSVLAIIPLFWRSR